MADTNRLAAVVAILAERDEDFEPFKAAALAADKPGHEPLWHLRHLKRLLGYEDDESIANALNRAKVASEKSGLGIRDHFKPAGMFGGPEDILLTKFGALLLTINANPEKQRVAIAQAYFALLADKQALEDEKRLRTRLEVATENNKLVGVAKDKGVQDFQKFNGVGIAALYGGNSVDQIKRMKGLPSKVQHLDFAGSEELAANLFRITQTHAALERQQEKDEERACQTHRVVGLGVRKAIINAGNQPPELLPPAKEKIDRLATSVKKRLKTGS